jgi:hypothetical protein
MRIALSGMYRPHSLNTQQRLGRRQLRVKIIKQYINNKITNARIMQLDNCGRRILMGDNTGGGAVMLRPIFWCLDFSWTPFYIHAFLTLRVRNSDLRKIRYAPDISERNECCTCDNINTFSLNLDTKFVPRHKISLRCVIYRVLRLWILRTRSKSENLRIINPHHPPLQKV